MPTINTQDNPLVASVGKTSADATVIESGHSSGVVTYEISRRDNQGTLRLSSSMDITKHPQVVSISSSSLSIILNFRTKYKVRVKRGSGGWSDWVNFKTRDKNYRTPDAITQLSDDTDNTPTRKTSRTIVVSNGAKATVTNNSRGARVVNNDRGYVGTTSITYTSRGATVRTDSF